MRRLLLDTGVVIAAERKQLDLSRVLHGDDDVAIAMITASELYFGVELASSEQQGARKAAVDAFIAFIAATPIEDHTLDVSRSHARLLAHCRRTGRSRGAHDLIIAATAAATGRIIVTTDTKAHFDSLPGVSRIVAR